MHKIRQVRARSEMVDFFPTPLLNFKFNSFIFLFKTLTYEIFDEPIAQFNCHCPKQNTPKIICIGTF